MITICIPVYNQVEYLSDAIQSALDQTIKCKVIVIDDGSTDGSGELAETFPVKVVHQVNKGLSSARNTGIMWAKTKYILFLDADDILLPNCVEEMLKKIEETDADIIAPSFKCFGTSNNLVILEKPTLEDFAVANRIGYFSAIKRDALLEIGGYSPRMIYGYEDYHLWINLLIKNKSIAIIKEPLVLYRTKEKSMWTEAVKHHEELMSQIKKDFPKLYE